MAHEAVFVLVSKEEAKNSFEARKLVVLKIWEEFEELYSPPYPIVGGTFSGLLSDLCGGKAIVPYYNIKLREHVKRLATEVKTFLEDSIEKSIEKRVYVMPSGIKDKFPELQKYNDDELLAAIKIEFSPIGLGIDLRWSRNFEIIYEFIKLYKPYVVTPDMLEKGRDLSLKLGYEDDAMIINECLYNEVIKKMIEEGKIIDIKDIGEVPIISLEHEEIIDKKWMVLVDYDTLFLGPLVSEEEE